MQFHWIRLGRKRDWQCDRMDILPQLVACVEGCYFFPVVFVPRLDIFIPEVLR
jgi:hypothetical protein